MVILRVVLLMSLLAGLILPSAAQSQAPPPEGVLRTEVRVINVYATVKDKKGQLVPNMTAQEFALLDDGQPQAISYFARESELSLLVILLVDTSTSQARVLAREQRIAAMFFERVLGPGDQAAVVAFDSNAYVLQGPTSDLAQLGRALQRIEPFAPGFAPQLPLSAKTNGTRMCAAVAWAAQLQPPLQVHRKVIILVTDGVDAELGSLLKPTLETALRSDVMIYSIRTIDPGVYVWWEQTLVEAGERALRRLARETGGLFFLGNNPRGLEVAFAQVAAEVRAQYSLGFTPRYLTYSTRFHPITVTINEKGAKVRARRGYFSPPQ